MERLGIVFIRRIKFGSLGTILGYECTIPERFDWKSVWWRLENILRKKIQKLWRIIPEKNCRKKRNLPFNKIKIRRNHRKSAWNKRLN